MTTHSDTFARICKVHDRACVDRGDDVMCPVGPHVVRAASWKLGTAGGLPSPRVVAELQRLVDEDSTAGVNGLAKMRAQRSEAGKKGGPARAAVLTPERRREISRMGNEARKARRA